MDIKKLGDKFFSDEFPPRKNKVEKKEEREEEESVQGTLNKNFKVLGEELPIRVTGAIILTIFSGLMALPIFILWAILIKLKRQSDKIDWWGEGKDK